MRNFGCSMLLAAMAEMAASRRGRHATPPALALRHAAPTTRCEPMRRRKLPRARENLTETEAGERLRRLAMGFRIQQDSDGADPGFLSRLGFWVEQDDILAPPSTALRATQLDLRKWLWLVQNRVQLLQNSESASAARPVRGGCLYRTLAHPICANWSRADRGPGVRGGRKPGARAVGDAAGARGKHWDARCSRGARARSPPPARRRLGTRDTLRALVIGDPADPRTSHDLPDARRGRPRRCMRLLRKDHASTLTAAGC